MCVLISLALEHLIKKLLYIEWGLYFIFILFLFHFMNTQKTQTSSNVKGFTLVELIVVITILVILGTIAFLNLGGMSAGARDSQRTSDLNQINQQVMTQQAKNGLSYMSMMSGSTSALTSASIAGATVAAGTTYSAGDVGYTVLGVDKAKFQDPIKGTAYKMGATTLAGSAYELAASLEESNTALVMGTYRARSLTDTASGTVSASTITLDKGMGLFKLGDIIQGTGTGKITAISADLKTITVDSTAVVSGTLKLAAAESEGLIGKVGDLATAVTNKGANLPYSLQ